VTVILDPGYPPCRHCGFGVEHVDGRWRHHVTGYSRCWDDRGLAEPDDPKLARCPICRRLVETDEGIAVAHTTTMGATCDYSGHRLGGTR